jgi:hypothetical protein
MLVVLMVAGAPIAAAQGSKAAPSPVKLSELLTAFLVDSGTRVRGLPWTTGSGLPITWETAGPVANKDQWTLKQGITHVRTGTLLGTAGDSVALPMTITVNGIAAGLSSVALATQTMQMDAKGGGYFVNRELVERGLEADGVTLQPIKCKRETEGASYGNLVDAVRLPGKTASGLWWHWENPQQAPFLVLTLLYRRTDMAQVECAGG